LSLDQADWAVSRRKNLEILDKRGAARLCHDGIAESLRCRAERGFVEQTRKRCTEFLGRGGARQGRAGAALSHARRDVALVAAVRDEHRQPAHQRRDHGPMPTVGNHQFCFTQGLEMGSAGHDDRVECQHHLVWFDRAAKRDEEPHRQLGRGIDHPLQHVRVVLEAGREVRQNERPRVAFRPGRTPGLRPAGIAEERAGVTHRGTQHGAGEFEGAGRAEPVDRSRIALVRKMRERRQALRTSDYSALGVLVLASEVAF